MVPDTLPAVQTRQLLRMLKRPPERIQMLDGGFGMPESYVWNVFQELRRRGEPEASGHFVSALRSLHRRRTIGAVEIPCEDPDPHEHRQADDPFLGELWKAYKRCLRQNRTGPAAQLLRDIEAQLN